MKDNKDTKVVNLEEKKIYTSEDKIITKDRLLAALIGLLVGIALTSIAYSVCIKIQHPGFNNNSGEVRKQERRKEAIIRKYKKKANKEAQTPSTETDENSQAEKSNESNN